MTLLILSELKLENRLIILILHKLQLLKWLKIMLESSNEMIPQEKTIEARVNQSKNL